MKKLLVIPLILFIVQSAFSQSHKFEWANSIGGKDALTFTYSSVTDKSGNIYSSGLFSGKNDFDPGPGFYDLTAKLADGYVLKCNSLGDFLWVKSIPASHQAEVRSITVDTFGNTYILGNYIDSITFDIGGSTLYAHTIGTNIFFAKLDTNGNFIWVKALKNSASAMKMASAEANKIKLDKHGNIFITGYFRNRLDFNPGTDSFFLDAKNDETFILKTNNLGDFIWAKNFQSKNAGNKNKSFDIDSQDNILLCGHFNDTIDVNPSTASEFLISKGYEDIYLVKLDSSGNYIWGKCFGDKRKDFAQSLVVDKSDNIIMSALFTDKLEVATDTGVLKILSYFAEEIIIMKFDQDGNFKWFKKFENATGGNLYDLKQDKKENIYLLADLHGKRDFDPGSDSFYLYSKSSMGVYLIRFDSAGNFNYVKSFGNDLLLYINPCIAIDQHDNVFITSNFSEHFDANPSVDSFILTSPDYDDVEAYTIKLTSCTPSFGKDSIASCGSFTLFDELYTKPGNYKKYIVNATGCDSVLSFKLTILPKPNAETKYVTFSHLACYNTGVTYQWVTCPGFIPIAGEINVDFYPAKYGSFAVIINNGECSDTSDCRTAGPGASINNSNLAQNTLKLYPNPFSQTTTLEFDNPQAKPHELSVFNALGQLVLHIENIKSNKLLVERKELQSGLYFYQLCNDEAVVGSGKMMIE